MPVVWGFDTQPFQPCVTVKKRYQGITGKVEFRSFPHWTNGGWEIQPVQLRPKIRQRYAGIKGKSSFAIFKTVRIIGTVRDSVGGTASYSVIVTQR